jgi:hypothetical protein
MQLEITDFEEYFANFNTNHSLFTQEGKQWLNNMIETLKTIVN